MDPTPTSSATSIAERFRRARDRRGPQDGVETSVTPVRDLFRETFGEEPPEPVAVSGYVPLAAEHTHYFGGFGLLVQLPGGVAVAVRPAPGEVRLEAAGVDRGTISQLVDALRARLALTGGSDIAVVSTLRTGGPEAILAAVAGALVQALDPGRDDVTRARIAAAAIQEVLGRPYGPSYVLAGAVGTPFVLVDAGSLEAMSVDPPENVGVGVLEVGEEALPEAAHFWERAALVEDALERLRERGMEGLTSLRRLEHQDLPAALDVLTGPARTLVRHLVTEDRRVPRMVAALKRSDSQLLGALLLMSQASRRDDTASSTDPIDFVVEAAGPAEGVHGARMAGPGYGGRVLVVGRPFLLSGFLDDMGDALASRFGRQPEAFVVWPRSGSDDAFE